MTEPLLRLGVSACLLGEMVRYDGGHQRNRYLTDTLAGDVDWRPLCPEVEVGMGVPRPTVRLEGNGTLRMIDPASGKDWTNPMNAWAEEAIAGLPDLDGFILKKDSPSCGPDRVKRYDGETVTRDGAGLFATALSVARPWLPVIDDGRLRDPGLREAFMEHAVWMRRWRDAGGTGMTARDLMEFHRIHKIAYMAHDPAGANRLGQLAASGDATAYLDAAAAVMGAPTTAGRRANALQHMLGYLSELESDDRQEVHDAIDDHRQGLVPLLVPLTLIVHHARKGPEWLREQTYLSPYPKEWMLRHGL